MPRLAPGARRLEDELREEAVDLGRDRDPAVQRERAGVVDGAVGRRAQALARRRDAPTYDERCAGRQATEQEAPAGGVLPAWSETLHPATQAEQTQAVRISKQIRADGLMKPHNRE